MLGYIVPLCWSIAGISSLAAGMLYRHYLEDMENIDYINKMKARQGRLIDWYRFH